MTSWRQATLPGTKHVSNSNRGKIFEAELDAMHDIYRRKGWVDMVKNSTEWIYINQDKYIQMSRSNPGLVAKTADGRCLRMKASNVDFSGGNRERSFIFDAKEISGDKFPFAKIKDHQVRRLLESAKCGTCSGVIIKFTELNRVFFVSISAFHTKFDKWFVNSQIAGGKRAEKGAASFSIEELEQIGCEIFADKMTGYPNWFPELNK